MVHLTPQNPLLHSSHSPVILSHASPAQVIEHSSEHRLPHNPLLHTSHSPVSREHAPPSHVIGHVLLQKDPYVLFLHALHLPLTLSHCPSQSPRHFRSHIGPYVPVMHVKQAPFPLLQPLTIQFFEHLCEQLAKKYPSLHVQDPELMLQGSLQPCEHMFWHNFPYLPGLHSRQSPD